MRNIEIYCLEDQEEKNIVVSLGEGKHDIGRGDTLKCNDKRVSRNHAEIVVMDSDVTLKSTHINPVFYKAANGKTIQILKNDESIPLNDGDHFALLADKFWFKVKLKHVGNYLTDSPKLNQSCKRSINAEKNNETFKRFKNTCDEPTIKSSKIEGVDSLFIVPENIIEENIDTDFLLNKLDNITKEDYGDFNVSNDGDFSDDLDGITDMASDKKDIPSEEELILSTNNLRSTDDLNINKNTIPIDSRVNSHASFSELESKEDEPTYESAVQYSPEEAEANNYVSDDTNESMDLAVLMKPVTNSENIVKPSEDTDDKESNSNGVHTTNSIKPKARRDPCWYAETCYRKNPSHRAEFSHPGDDDFNNELADDRPQCQYGASCYRKNADHRREFKHTLVSKPDGDGMQKIAENSSSSQLGNDDGMSDTENYSTNDRTGKKRKATQKVKKLDTTPEDDYDMEDPFINDGSSDDYQQSSESSDDTDLEDSQTVEEDMKETRRLLKEAKKFTKV